MKAIFHVVRVLGRGGEGRGGEGRGGGGEGRGGEGRAQLITSATGEGPSTMPGVFYQKRKWSTAADRVRINYDCLAQVQLLYWGG